MELSIKDMRDLLCPQNAAPALSPSSPTHKIVIADRGWVFVGEASRTGDTLHLRNASVIRRWGTTSGLGQLALHGPQKDTVLDPCGYVTIPLSSVVAELDTMTPWKK